MTGATGGVGSLAVDILSGLGYEVSALTGKRQAIDYLKGLGASEIVLREELEIGERPLESARWGGAVDNVGGDLLGWITRTVKPRGNIASIGLAGGFALNTTVMPFILRGVNLLGINTVVCPLELKNEIWRRLAGEHKPSNLEAIASREISLEELAGVFGEYMEGGVVGRTVVRIGGMRNE